MLVAILIGAMSCYASQAGLVESVADGADGGRDGEAGEEGSSDVEAWYDAAVPVCGNRVVEPREECDQDSAGECATPCGSVGRRSCIDCTWAACAAPPETCNGLDDDCNGMTDDVGGSTGCGNGCCNAGEDPCTCPDDCGSPAAPAVPAPLRPLHGARIRSRQPAFRWLPSAAVCGPPTYDVEVDDSCSSPGFASCAFPSLEFAGSSSATGLVPGISLPVSAVPPVGQRYYWRVRACAGRSCSAWSPVRYVDVGMAELDFNGDGYSDLVVGSYQHSSADLPGGWATGVVYLYYGTATGIADSSWVELANPEVPDTDGAFGSRLAGSDLNGDGFSDLVVGALSSSSFGTGTDVYVYFGRAGGIPSGPDLVLHEPELRRQFGASLAGLGDVDADGFGELAIGAAGRVGGNEVLVYPGGPAGPGAPPITVVHPPPWAHSAFGLAVGAGGDFDGDGHGEVVVGAPLFDGSFEDEGRVFAYAGVAGGVGTTPSVTIEDPEPEPAHLFGFSVARGDLNGDGFAEVIVGAPGPTDEGEVFVYLGEPGGLEAAPWSRLVPPATLPSGQDGFGRGMAVCDVNGDGHDDLAVTAPLQRREATSETYDGAVFVWYGRDGAAPVAPGTILWGPPLEDSASFANGLGCVGDLNGDGYDDLAVGAPREGLPAHDGRVYLYPGAPAGPAESPLLVLDHPNPSTVAPGAAFGATIVSR